MNKAQMTLKAIIKNLVITTVISSFFLGGSLAVADTSEDTSNDLTRLGTQAAQTIIDAITSATQTVEQRVVANLIAKNLLVGDNARLATDLYATKANLTVNGATSSVSINYGATTTIAWNASNAKNCKYSLDGGKHYILHTEESAWFGTSYTKTTAPLTATTKVVVSCSNSAGALIPEKITVNVIPLPAPSINSLTIDGHVSSSSVEHGNTVVIAWTTSNTETCSLNKRRVADVASGNKSYPNVSTTTPYTLECSNAADATTTATVFANILPLPKPNIVFTAATSSTSQTYDNTISVDYKSDVVLDWSVGGAEYCELDNVRKGKEGPLTLRDLTASTTKTLECFNKENATSSRSIAINVAPQNDAEVTLTVASSSINWNTGTTLSWTTKNVKSCDLDTKDVAVSRNNYPTGRLSTTTTYVLTCENDYGNPTVASTTVEVVPVVDAQITSFSIASSASSTVKIGTGTTLSWSTTNANSCTLRDTFSGRDKSVSVNDSSYNTGALYANNSYILTCTHTGGNPVSSESVNVSIEAMPAVLTFVATPTNVGYLGSTTLTWSSNDATNDCDVYKVVSGVSNRIASGKQSPTRGYKYNSLASTTKFEIICKDARSINIATSSATVTVQAVDLPNTNIFANSSSASTVEVNSGETANISWRASNAVRCTVKGGRINKTGTEAIYGYQNTGAITGRTTYTQTCWNSANKSASSSVTVAPKGLPNVSFSAGTSTRNAVYGVDTPDSATIIVANKKAVTFDWYTSGPASRCTLDGKSVGNSGPKPVTNITKAKIWTLKCTGVAGSVEKSINVLIAGSDAANAYLESQTDTDTDTPDTTSYNIGKNNSASVLFTADQVMEIIKLLLK
ncbi:MAG: hypothetical protein WCO30_01350 [bacterium]